MASVAFRKCLRMTWRAILLVCRGALTYLEETRPKQKDLFRLNASGCRFYIFDFLIESIVNVSMIGADLEITMDVWEC